MSMTDFDNIAKWGQFIRSLPRMQKFAAFAIIAFISFGWIYVVFGPLRSARSERAKLVEDLKQSEKQLATVRDEKATIHRELLSYKEILDPIQKKAVQLYPELETAAALAKLAQDLDTVRSLATRDSYRPLSPNIKQQVVGQLKAIAAEVGTNLTIEVMVENGSVSRQRVAKALVDVLIEAGVSTKGPSGMTSFFQGVPSTMSFELNPDDLTLANRIAGAVGLFINQQMEGVNRPKQAHGLFKIHLVGEPLFSADGVVTFK
jgi:hypothetical protein